MAVEGSRSSSTADSYIGSLISLTSKSEIRYEGILYDINTDESSIGLRNVRSFGTEGRKKDGPQVMPSDKVYEYILFRGSDIKDLQVKSSPPAQTVPPSDPAIIQSHYPRPASTSSSLLAAGNGSLTDLSSHTPQLGQHPVSTFQGGLPLYQPGGNLGSWGPSPPPSASGNGLAMPMYWPGPGFYGPPNGLPQFQQQSLLRPPPGLPMPPSLQQQPMQYSGFNTSLPAGPSSLPEYPSSGPTSTLSLNLTSTSLPPSSLPSNLPPLPPGMLGSDSISSLVPNKVLSGSVPSLSPLTTSTPDVNPILPPMSNKPNVISAPALPYQGLISNPVSSIVGKSSSVQSETATPSLVTPGQLLQAGQVEVSSSQSSQTAHKDVEVVQVAPTPSPEPPTPVQAEAQPPLLPLPPPSRTVHKPNGAHFQPRHSYRGHERGRGSGSSRPMMKFTEEFDFMAMNEKFNKDEVWGHLGRSNKSTSKEDGNGSDEYDSQDEDDSELPKFEVKPVYSKDDFFDTLSSNALDNQSNHGRTRFSEQMKIDTETFGEFSRYRGGRGGRGPFRGGRSRGSYYGRGYGYMGRGRGRSMPSRDF